MLIHDIYSDEITGGGVEPEYTGLTTAGGLLLAKIDNVAILLQVHDQFGHGRNAQVHHLANICNGSVSIGHEEMDDFFLQEAASCVIL